MALKGDLASVDLAQMFQMLALNKKVGLLSIQSPRFWKILYFDGRGVTLYYNPHDLLDRTIAAFVRCGRLQPQAVEEIRAHASRNQLPLLDGLLAGGYLREADLAEQMQYELEEEVYDLFFCKDARFEFHEGVNKLPEREGVVDERFFLNTESVIMEAARRIDEWSYISERITSGLEVFCPTDQPYVGGKGDHDTQSVYDHVDGRTNVARIVEITSLPSFAVFKSLCQLFDGGFVVQLPEKSIVPTGKACLAAGHTQDAINLFEKAIEQQIGVPQVHTLAAEAYQSVFEYESAVYHLQCNAEYKIAAHDYRGAAQQLKAATALVPTDLSSRDRLVEIALAHDLRSSDFDAVAAGKELVDLFLAAGEINRVRALLERLLHARPDDLDLKKLLVNVHSKAGDQVRVIELYLSIADTLVADHKPLEAVGYLQKILMLDRSRSDVSERVRSLYTLDERTRSRRRTLIGLGVLSVLLFVLGLAYQWYDSRAAEDFEHIDVAAMLQASEFEHAELEYQRFVTEHPFATVNSRANEALARIGGLRLKHEAELANQRAAHDLDVQKLRQEYRTEWRHHAELFKAGKAEESLAALERVAKLVRRSNLPEDHAWALEQGVENNLTRLRAFLEKATDLRHRSEDELAAGHVDMARTLAIDLLTNYDIAAAAKGATIPVRFQSRPMGAQILRGGVPLTAGGAGGQQPLRTPALVMCGRDPAEFTFQLDGFEPAVARVDARQQAVVDEPLVVIPDRRIRFAAPVSLLGIGGGHLVAGLRTGKVAIASLSTGQVLRTIDLGGLREMDGEPVVTNDRVFFSSNEGTLECWRLDNGRALEGWPLKLASGVASEIAARDGRIVFVDRDGQVCCFDQAGGRLLWRQPCDCVLTGSPTIERRVVRVAGTEGRIVTLDATDGHVLSDMRLPLGISTRVLADGGMLWVGGTDGKVHAIDEAQQKERWRFETGRPVADVEIALARSALVVVCNGKLFALDRADGSQRGVWPLAGALQGPLRVAGDRLLVNMRQKDGKEKPRDTLLAFRADALTLLWQYADAGTFADVAASETQQAVAGGDGEAVLLR